MPNIIPGTGNPRAKIVLVGEAPGEEEDKLGKPFVGRAGYTLDQLLRNAGIARAELYITNVVKQRPPNNNFGVFYIGSQPTEALLKWRAELIKELSFIKPTVVVPLGNEALSALTGKWGISNWRGSILWSDVLGCKVIPTLHPSFIQRGQWEKSVLVVMDLQRAKEQSLFPEYRVVLPTITVASQYDEAMYLLDQLLISKEPISFDIETFMGALTLTSIAFATDPNWGFAIPFISWNGNRWSEHEEINLLTKIRQVLECDVPKIAQNIQFDGMFFRTTMGIMVRPLFMDTMIAHFDCYPEIPKGLDTIASIYTDIPYWKYMSSDNLFVYNGWDAVATFRVAKVLESELVDLGMKEFYYKLDHALLEPLMDMQMRGTRIDVDKKITASKEIGEEITRKSQILNEESGFIVNVNSPKQIAELLYDKLGMPIQTNRKTGKTTANEEAIEKLANKYPNPVLDMILELRGLLKLKSTYLDAPLDADGRIRCSYLIGGTETGRLSSRESIRGTGTNLQNIPRSGICRELFLPDEGKILVEADLSQAEARVVAYLCNDETMIQAFEEGGDIHKKMASLIFNIKVEEVTPDQRQLAKTVVHACNYKVGILTLARLTKQTKFHAEALQQKYYNTFQLRTWHFEVEQELVKTKTLVTPMGRRRQFFGHYDDNLVREAIAYVPQSTVADILNTVLIRIDKAFKSDTTLDAQLLLQVHDSVVLQCKPAQFVAVCLLLKEAFAVAVPIKGRILTIPYEIKTGKDWGNMEKI